MGSGFREVPLYAKGEVVAYAKVDPEDYREVTEYRWRLLPRGYAIRSSRPAVLMHRFILDLTSKSGHAHKGKTPEVDHINRNKLDNRRANLRVVDRKANIDNRAGYGTSQVKGVCFAPSKGLWKSYVPNDSGGQVHLGWFRTEEDAVAALRAHEASTQKGEPDA